MKHAHSTTYYHVPNTASPLVEIIDHDDERVTVSYDDGCSTVILFFNDASTLSVLIDELKTARDELIEYRHREREEAQPENLNMQPSVHSS